MTAAQARFLQVDPVGYQDDLDLYTYVQDDPANATDPSGRWECTNCNNGQNGAINAAQGQLRGQLPGKIAVLRSLQAKLASGGTLNAAETQAAAMMDKYLGVGAGENGSIVGHLMQYANGILGAVNSNRPANLADRAWPLSAGTSFSEYSTAGDRMVINNPNFFRQSSAEIVQTIAHESVRRVGDGINAGPVAMSYRILNISGTRYRTQGRDSVAAIAATRAYSPDAMLDILPDASVSALGY